MSCSREAAAIFVLVLSRRYIRIITQTSIEVLKYERDDKHARNVAHLFLEGSPLPVLPKLDVPLVSLAHALVLLSGAPGDRTDRRRKTTVLL